MGAGPLDFSSKSSAEQIQKTANDQGQFNEKGVVVSNGQGIAARQLNAGIQQGRINAAKGSTVNVTYGDGGQGVADLTNQFLSSIGQITSGQADQTKTLTEKLAELLQSQSDSDSDNKSAEETSGLTTIQKTVFGLGALTLAGIVLWPKTKKK
jgi:hypothetical protein